MLEGRLTAGFARPLVLWERRGLGRALDDLRDATRFAPVLAVLRLVCFFGAVVRDLRFPLGGRVGFDVRVMGT